MLVRDLVQDLAQPMARDPWGKGGASYPPALALLYDADKAPTRELTGKGHNFNSAVLSPQYQRNADGSYTDVGANPAVDTIDGEKWLRICGAVTNLFAGDTSIARAVSLTSGTVYTLHVFGAGTVSCSYGEATVAAPLTITASATASVTFTPAGATYWMLTVTSYSVPYTPPGTTMPASNATTTNGCWFTLADGSPVWKALTGQTPGMTLATRVRMGVGGADLPRSTTVSILTQAELIDGVQGSSTGTTGAANRIVRSYDGANSIIKNEGWARNAIIRRATQVSSSGLRFRVGYMIEGVHTTMQWSHTGDESTWPLFDGSFNPSTLYRLMLGYNNAYTMWFNKIAVWNKQMDDAAILEALN